MKTSEYSIESYISKLLTAGNDSELKEIQTSLSKVLVSPLDVYRSPLISETHPLKIDALRIIEGFEAVTNGMHHPGVFENLDAVDDASPFASWKYFCFAVRALYNGEEENALIQMGNIPSSSPLHSMKELFECRSRGLMPKDDPLKKFYNRLFDKDILFTSAVDQLEEALENGLEDLFIETSRMLLQQLKDTCYQDSCKLAGWVISQTGIYDFDINPVIDMLNSIFGPQEGYRLSGSVFYKTDPDISLFFFLKSLDRSIHDTSKNDDYIKTFLVFLQELILTVSAKAYELQIDIQFWSRIEKIIESISINLHKIRQIEILYKQGAARDAWLNFKSSSEVDVPIQNEQKSRIYIKKSVQKAVQLELFS